MLGFGRVTLPGLGTNVVLGGQGGRTPLPLGFAHATETLVVAVSVLSGRGPLSGGSHTWFVYVELQLLTLTWYV